MADYGFDFRYSFGAWLECEGPVATCAEVSSPGAYGFTPWVDHEWGYRWSMADTIPASSGATTAVFFRRSPGPVSHLCNLEMRCCSSCSPPAATR